MDRSLPVDVTAIDGHMRRIVDKHMALIEVKQRLPVCRRQMLRGEHVLRRAGGHDPAREQQNMIRNPSLGEIVGGDHHGAAS